jgi:hypothetical protein
MTTALGKAKHGSGGSWAIGLLVLIGPYLILEFGAPTNVSVWARIYLAGAVGGLCFELIRNRWRLEMPSSEKAGRRSAEPTFAPLGPLQDVGFLGRMLTGAVAAPTFIAIVSVLDANDSQQGDLSAYLESLGTRPDTVAWGVAAGFAAPAVWTLIEQFIAARGAVANTRLETRKAETAVIHTKAEQALEALKAAPSSGNGGGSEAAAARINEIIGVAEAGARAAEPPVVEDPN